jgi:3-deoxy-7-phosphoheptulonate synthase
VEVHPNPDRAMSDGAQTLFPEQFRELVEEALAIAEVLRKKRAASPVQLEPVVSS